MEISKAQFEEISECLPRQRGNVSLTNLQVLNAILYVAEHGCKWRGLPKRFGNWHTIYTRMNRWAKSSVLDRAFEQLQRAQIVQIKLEAVSLDSTSVKVHPDGTGAPKKAARKLSQVPWWLEHQDPPRRGGRAHGHNLLAVTRPSTRRPRGTCAAQALGQAQPAAAPAHGSRLRG